MTSIKIIRQKILEQAMRGELVSQNEKDEHASVLLSKIQEKKQKLIDQKQIKKQNPLPPVDENELPYEIPEGWVWVRLGEIGQIVGGGTPKTNIEEYWSNPGEGIPWLTPADLSGYTDMYISGGKRDISKLGLEKSSAILLPKGSVLFSSRAPIGYVAIASNEISTNQGFKSVVPYLSEMNIFIYYFLMYVGKKINEQATGTTFKEVSGKVLSHELIPLPPINEQKRIVKKVLYLLNLCDQWEHEVEFQNQRISILRDKVFNDALHGLLVPQNENDEPASVTLEKIQMVKEELIKSKKMKKTEPLSSIEENEIPHELPSGWTWVRIRDIAQINPRNSLDDELEVGFVPMKLIEDGYSGKHSSETRQWKEVKKGFTHFKENDIAIAKITPCFENKKSAIMKNLANGYGAGTTELHIVRPFHDYVLAEYLMCLFKSNTFIEKGVQTYTGTAGQQRVSKDFIENYVIGLPPIEEQKRIVEKVNKVWEIINEIERNIISVK